MAVGRIGYRNDFWIYYDTNNVRRAFKGSAIQDPLELDNGNFGQITQDGFVYKDGSGQWRLFDGNEVDNNQAQSDGSIPRGIGVRGIRFYYNGPIVLDRIRGDIDDPDTNNWSNISASTTSDGENITVGWTAGTIRHLTRTFEVQRKEENEIDFATIATGIGGVSGNTYTDSPGIGDWSYRILERRIRSTGSSLTKLSNTTTSEEIEDPCVEITETASNINASRNSFESPFAIGVNWNNPSSELPEGSTITVTVDTANNTASSDILSRFAVAPQARG